MRESTVTFGCGTVKKLSEIPTHILQELLTDKCTLDPGDTMEMARIAVDIEILRRQLGL
jgi:hypothetical protein